MHIDSIKAINAGPAPLIAAICDELKLESTINDLLDWHPSYWEVSPGTHIKALIINALCSRLPLYRVEDFYQEHDVELLLRANRTAQDFNDYVLGRVLDLLHESEAWRVYSTWALSVVNKLGLSIDVIHSDTTSFSVEGQFANTEDLAVGRST